MMTDPGRPALVPATIARGTRGAVASPHHLASQAGLGVLRAGGSAVDAAIATNAALAVVTSFMCGLGGDAFWLIAEPGTGRVLALNGSGRSARRATIERARAAGLDEIPVRGPWTVTVPGAIDSWGEAHARFGRLPWADLLAPAAELADGFPASAAWVTAIERAARVHGEASDWARSFRPEGRPWVVGGTVRLPALAATLRILAAEGPDAAYRGSLAQRAAAFLEEAGSPLRLADLTEHRSDWGEPVATTYRGVTSLSHGPNSCGPIALELLGVLERFAPPPPEAFTPDGVTDARWVHLGLEAARLTMADRDTFLTDPAAMAPGALDRLLSAGHAGTLASRIDPDRAAPPVDTTLRRGGGTIHLCTADAAGGLVSLVESNYAGFGSGLVDPETGIAYQNRGAFFRLDAAHANSLQPGKRTLHTLTPGMLVRDGLPWIAHGQMGGEIQPQVFAQFVSAVVDGGLGIATALAAPRWAADVVEHFGPPSLTVLEGGFDPAVADGLAARGHAVTWTEPFSSGMGHEHAVEIVRVPSPEPGHGGSEPPTTLAAATDPRSEGLPATW